MNPLDRLSNVYARVPGLSWLSRLARPGLRKALALAIAIVALLLLLWILIGVLPLLPARFWQLAGLCAIALAVLWWFLVGARRYSRRGFSSKRIGDLGPGNPEDERAPLARMRAAIAEAKGTIQRSPDIDKGRDPLYRVPWLLFLGDADADVAGVLAAASQVSPFPPPRQDRDPEQLWRWWFFKSMIAIEAHPRVVCEPGARLERGLWYQALTLLASERDKLALNGIVVCIAAQTLLSGADAAKAAGIRLRRLVDEAMEHLQLRLPVYFLVTGLERLHGYAEFRHALPAEAFAQALGFRLPETEVVNAATSGKLDEILGPIIDRLHALRETALRSQATPATRRGVFEFVQSLARLSDGLHVFVTQLLEDNPFQRTPRWRGLYFGGGSDGAHPGGAFVADLFTRLLPGDQPLAVPSVKGDAGRLAGAALGVAAMLGLSGYLSYGLFAARQDDSQLLAQTRAACRQTQGAGAGGRIAWVAACGRTIEQLEAAAAKTSLGFGIRRADTDIEQLKQQVVQDFSRLILAPYEQMLSTDLARGQAGLEHALAVAQRLRLLADCRRRREDCSQRERVHNVVFDPASRLFAPFQSGDADVRIDRDRASALFSTYLGYLRWQDDDVLDDEQQRLRGEFEQLMTRYRPRPADVETWARRRPAVGLKQFWLPADRVVAVDPGTLPSISAAYTLEIWQGVLAPWLQTAVERVPQRKAALADFRKAYFDAYFRAWGRFQARFLEGVGLWRGHYRDLLQRAASPDNPYRFFFETAQRDLFGLPLQLPLGTRWATTWAQIKSDGWRGWRPAGRFIGDTVAGWFSGQRIKPPPWVPALQESLSGPLRKQAPLYAKAYLQLGEDGSGTEVYQLAVAFYQAKGRAGDGPAADYAQLLQALDKPAEKFATQFRSEDLTAWSIVQGPARLLLLLTVYRAGEYVQARWIESIVQPLARLPANEQVATLYGAQGKLDAFVNDWLKPFVTEKERIPVKVAGIAMPLAPAFQRVVSAERQLLPVLTADKPFMAGAFVFSGPTETGAIAEGADGTVLEIDCKGERYRAASNAPSLVEAKVTVFWSPASCAGALIRISLAEPVPAALAAAINSDPVTAATPPAAATPATPAPLPPPPAAGPDLSLTRIYPGPEGFVQLLEDFQDGEQAYALDDFRASYTPTQWRDLLPRLRAAEFSQARVHLQAEPSEEMQRYLAARERPTSLPARIVE